MINNIDNFFSILLRRFTETPQNENLCKLIAHLGDLTIHILFFPILYYVGNSDTRKILKGWLLGTIKVIFILLLIKPLFKRKRPIDKLPKEYSLITKKNEYSFPSGHSLRNFFIAEFFGNKFPTFKPILYIYAILNGLSRVALGLHYLTDIIVGAIIGIFIAKKQS